MRQNPARDTYDTAQPVFRTGRTPYADRRARDDRETTDVSQGCIEKKGGGHVGRTQPSEIHAKTLHGAAWKSFDVQTSWNS